MLVSSAGSRIALCGGLSGAGPLDSLLLLSGDFGPELGPLAAAVSLARASSAASAASSSNASSKTHRSGCGQGPRVATGQAAGLQGGRRASPGPAGASVRWADSSGSSAAVAAGESQALQGAPGGGADLAAVQLTELLRRRNVAEAAAEAGRRAELAERLFAGERRKSQGLQAEVRQRVLLGCVCCV